MNTKEEKKLRKYAKKRMQAWLDKYIEKLHKAWKAGCTQIK